MALRVSSSASLRLVIDDSMVAIVLHTEFSAFKDVGDGWKFDNRNKFTWPGDICVLEMLALNLVPEADGVS